MEKNVGATESKVRYGVAVVAAVLATRAGLDTRRGRLLAGVAAVAGITGAIGFCPLWKALGITTAGREEPAGR